MNRSLWPEGVEVHQQDLVRETQDTINAIATRYTSTTLMGIVGGLEVVPAVSAGKIKISNGIGYSPNGEQVVVPVEQNNVSLATYTLGALNYVLAVYTEVYGDPQAHEDLGTTLPTSAVGSFRIAVLDASTWNSLPLSDPNLNNNSRDRSVLLAIVTATGSSLNPIAQGDIQGPTAYSPVYYVAQPATISGVYINGVSTNTLPGSGILTFTIVSGQYFLQWAAPGDVAGPVSPAITGNTTLTLLSGSTSPQYTITMTITFIDLPTSPSTIVNNIIISSIYDQPIPRLSAIDDAHRHMLGSGIPSTKNPHALTLADIGVDIGGVIQQHQVEMHANGLLDPTNIGAASPSLTTTILSASGINDVVRVNPMTAGGVIYINGLRILGIVGSTDVAFDDVNANYIELYGVFMEANGTLSKKLRMQLNPGYGEAGTPPGTSPDPFQGNVMPIDLSDYNTVFDSLQDITLAFDPTAAAGQPAFRLIPPVGWSWPVVWTSINNWNPSTNILRLPYPTSATDSTVPVAAALNYIDIWINPLWVPVAGPAKSVTMRIFARPSAETSYLISYVVSQGKPPMNAPATVMLGWGTYGSLPTLRTYHTVDRRLFGTLAGLDINNATIGKEKIKDLSQSQVFNAIGYVPYNGVANPSGFALRAGAPGAEPVVTSHVLYADVAGSGGSTATWPVTGTPFSLVGMTGGNAFNTPMYFNNGVEIPYNQVLRWGVNQNIVGTNTGGFSFNSNVGSIFNGPIQAPTLTSTGAISAGTTITAGGTITSGGNINLPGAANSTVTNVRLPTSDNEAANKAYVDASGKGAIVSYLTLASNNAPPAQATTTPLVIGGAPMKFGPGSGYLKLHVGIQSLYFFNIGSGDRAYMGILFYYLGAWTQVGTIDLGWGNMGHPQLGVIGTVISTFAYQAYDGWVKVTYYSTGPTIDMYNAECMFDFRTSLLPLPP